MKILAIIPARAGSRGIPNKNIRLVAGKPLAYYSINNALKSKYITDVIVTTDSGAVKTLSQQMGAKVHWRDEALCKDDITLDAVIYDAIPKDINWDYIVTMQPTSPTLKVNTLDKAIESSIKNKYDTVISAINKPHLSWKEENGKIVANYEKRLNRQYLPANFLETGAFVISKYNIVTEFTRIGSNVTVYNLPETEAQDVDTYTDLAAVSFLLDNKKVAIYVNGNNKRGMGHIYRALEISDEFYTKPDIFYDINQTDKSIFGKTTHNLIAVNGLHDLFEKSKKGKYDIFINDILSTSIDYMIALKTVLPNAKIINFEDDGEGTVKSDLTFNALYGYMHNNNIFSGEKYYICNKMFTFYNPIEVREKVESIFISFGGADPQNYSDRLLEIVKGEEYKNYNFYMALGRAKQNVEALMKYNKYNNINVYYDVENMPELMSKCDIAITSRGRTGYELAILGIPTIAMSQNPREEKHNFVSGDNGFDYIGLNPSDEIIKANLDMYINLSKKAREHYQTRLLKHDLKNGRKRVMDLINNL